VTTRPRCRASAAAASRDSPPAPSAPHRGLGGWREPVLPLAPPGRRGVIAGDLHHGFLIGRGGDGLWWNRRLLLQPKAMAVPHVGSLVATVLSAARDALDERCLVGTDASDLSALAGARAGTVGATLQMHKH
jgi:hypothetical protein